MIEIPNLKIDRDGDDPDTHVMLQQDDMAGTIHHVYLHPVQVRLIAERMGIVAPSSNIEADRTIRRLCRQMRILFERIDQMDDMLLAIGAKGHECVDEECAYSAASLDIAREFLHELPLDESGKPIIELTPEPTPAPAAPLGEKARQKPASGQLALEGGS